MHYELTQLCDALNKYLALKEVAYKLDNDDQSEFWDKHSIEETLKTIERLKPALAEQGIVINITAEGLSGSTGYPEGADEFLRYYISSWC